MKKLLLICLLSIVSAALWSWEMPDRYFEMGFDYELGMANTVFSWGDIFNSARTVEVDLDKIGESELGLDALLKANFFMNYQSRGKYKLGFGVFSGVDGHLFGSLSQEAAEILFHGNGGLSRIEGSVTMGGGVFADLGLRGSAQINKWKFSASPAVYMPLLYMSSPDINYSFSNGDPFTGGIRVKSDVYTAFAFDDDLAIQEFQAPTGLDLSLDVSYQLLPFLALGGAITHIPIVPAVMTNRLSIDRYYEINSAGKSIQDLIDEGLDLDALFSESPSTDHFKSLDANQAVFRPLRFDAYGVFEPLKMEWLRLSLKPSLGLSVLTVYEEACFNVGLETQLKLINMFGLSWDFRYREKVWLNKINLMLNFRVMELDFGAGFRSLDLPGAFTAKGLFASFGLRFGF